MRGNVLKSVMRRRICKLCETKRKTEGKGRMVKEYRDGVKSNNARERKKSRRGE